MRSAADTAVLVKLLVLRSDQKRARISEKTIKLLANRQRLRAAFVTELQSELEELGLMLVELASGGFGIVTSVSLEGAPTITAKKYMWDEFVRFRKDPRMIEGFRREVQSDGELEENDD